MNGPEKLEHHQLGRPGDSQLWVELRFTNQDGKTEAWLLRKETLDFEGLSSPKRVALAYLDGGVDTRIGNQIKSIERLQRHVEAHHEDIADVRDSSRKPWKCDWSDPGAPAA